MCLSALPKTLNKQRGLGSIGWLFMLSAGAFLLACFFKLGPVYLDDLTMIDALKTLGERNPNLHEMENGSIRSQLDKYLVLNNVRDTTAAEAFQITREQNKMLVDNVYEKRIPFFANIDVVLTFKHQLDSSNPSVCCEYLIDTSKDED